MKWIPILGIVFWILETKKYTHEQWLTLELKKHEKIAIYHSIITVMVGFLLIYLSIC